MFCATETESSEESVGDSSKSDQHYFCVESSEELQEEGEDEEAEQELCHPHVRVQRHTYCEDSASNEDKTVEESGLPPLKVEGYFRHSESSDDEEIEEEIDHRWAKKYRPMYHKYFSSSEEEIEEEAGLTEAQNDSYLQDSEQNLEEEIQEEPGCLQVSVWRRWDLWSTACSPVDFSGRHFALLGVTCFEMLSMDSCHWVPLLLVGLTGMRWLCLMH